MKWHIPVHLAFTEPKRAWRSVQELPVSANSRTHETFPLKHDRWVKRPCLLRPVNWRRQGTCIVRACKNLSITAWWATLKRTFSSSVLTTPRKASSSLLGPRETEVIFIVTKRNVWDSCQMKSSARLFFYCDSSWNQQRDVVRYVRLQPVTIIVTCGERRRDRTGGRTISDERIAITKSRWLILVLNVWP